MAKEFVIKNGLIINDTQSITGITNNSGLTYNSSRVATEDAIKKYIDFKNYWELSGSSTVQLNNSEYSLNIQDAFIYDYDNDLINIKVESVFGDLNNGGLGDVSIISNTNGGSGTLRNYIFSSAGGVHGENHFRRASGDFSSPSDIPSYATMWITKYQGYVNGTGWLTGAEIATYSTGTWTSSSSPARIELKTTSSNSTTPSNRLSIDNNELIMNDSYDDYNIFIRKISSGDSFKYDAGNDEFYFYSPINLSSGTSINNISTDSGFTNPNDNSISTSLAIKNYINNSINSVGSDQQIIFNSGGTLSGSNNFTYDSTTFNMIGKDPTGVTLYVSNGVVAGGFASLDFSGTTQPVRQTDDHYKMWLNVPSLDTNPHCIGLYNGGTSSKFITGYGGTYDTGMTHIFEITSNEYGGAEFKLYDEYENLTINLNTTESEFYTSVIFNSTTIIKTGITWTNSNGTEIIVNSNNHRLIDYEEIIVTGSTDETSLPNNTYNISVIDENSFKILVLTNTSGSGTLNYTRESREYLTTDSVTGDIDMDSSLEIKNLTVNQNYQNGNFNMLTPAILESGDAGGFDHYWVGGTITTGDIIRSISHIGYSGLTGTFSIGDYVTGRTSNATAKITRVDGFQVEVLLVDDVSGTFVSGETITADNGATGLVQEFNSHTPATFEMISTISTFVGNGYVKNVVGIPTPGDCAIKVGDNDFFQINNYDTGSTFINTEFENKRIIFGPTEPSNNSDEDSHIFSSLDGDDVRSNFSSQGQNAWLKISITDGSSFLRLSRNGRNSNIATEEFNGPDGIIKMDSTSIQTIYTSGNKIEFNYENNDLDFIINKNIVDEAYRYDAGNDTHNYYSTLNVYNNDISIIRNTSDAEIKFITSSKEYKIENEYSTGNLKLFNVTDNYNWVNFTLSGTNINPNNKDLDFKILKNSSNTALTYDA